MHSVDFRRGDFLQGGPQDIRANVAVALRHADGCRSGNSLQETRDRIDKVEQEALKND